MDSPSHGSNFFDTCAMRAAPAGGWRAEHVSITVLVARTFVRD
jgi:hypothetical protein